MLKVENLSSGAQKAFSYILHNHPATRANISAKLNIGASSVCKFVQDLIDNDLIIEVGAQESSGGRKPIAYAPNSKKGKILCINISTIYCEIAISDFNLHLSNIIRFKNDISSSPDEVVTKIWATFESIKEEEQLTNDDFVAAGVVLFAAIKDSSGIMYKPIVQYTNEKWLDYPIIDKLKEIIPFPIFSEKGITALASLENNYGIGRNYKSMLYVLCAMNIRSAFVIDGKVQKKSPFYEDAFGHMVINYNGPLCSCGQYGCLNCYSSIPIIIDEFKKKIRIGEKTSFNKDLNTVSIEDICLLAENNDKAARETIIHAARIFGIALSNHVNVTNPDIVLVEGLITELSSLYYETSIEVATKRIEQIGNIPPIFKKLGSFSNPLTTAASSLVLDLLFLH